MSWCPLKALRRELAGAREGGCSGSAAGAALISEHLAVGVIPVAHRLDRRVSQWLFCKDVKAGTDPARPTGIVCRARGPGTLRTGTVGHAGAHRENPRWPLVLLQVPSPLPGEVVGFHRGWLRAGTAPGFKVGQGYNLFPQRLFNCPCADAGRQGQGNKGIIMPF